MPTEKPRFTLTLDYDTDRKLNEYWHRRQLKSKNEAINELLLLALNERNQINNLTAKEERLLNSYRELPGVAKSMLDASVIAGASYANEHYPTRNLFHSNDIDGLTVEEVTDDWRILRASDLPPYEPEESQNEEKSG